MCDPHLKRPCNLNIRNRKQVKTFLFYSQPPRTRINIGESAAAGRISHAALEFNRAVTRAEDRAEQLNFSGLHRDAIFIENCNRKRMRVARRGRWRLRRYRKAEDNEHEQRS